MNNKKYNKLVLLIYLLYRIVIKERIFIDDSPDTKNNGSPRNNGNRGAILFI